MLYLVLECSSKARWGNCARIGKECWCYYPQSTLPSDVCGYPQGYGGRYYSIGKHGSDTVHLPLAIIKAVGKAHTSSCTNSNNGCIPDCATNTCTIHGCQGTALTCYTNEKRWRRNDFAGIVRCEDMDGK